MSDNHEKINWKLTVNEQPNALLFFIFIALNISYKHQN